MNGGSLVALSRQCALQRSLEVIAQNLANVSTPGYKSERVLFDTIVKELTPGHKLAFTKERRMVRDFSPGYAKETENELHLMIAGEDEFFILKTNDGNKYTRCGAFELDEQGRIINSEGAFLLSDQRSQIKIPEGTSKITVSADGTVSADKTILGKIGIAKFSDPQNLIAEEKCLYKSNTSPNFSNNAKIIQGMLEQSNVAPITEISKMIEALRRYQEIQQTIDSDKERNSQSVDKLVKVI